MEDMIRGHEHNFSLTPDGRCKCLLNGHVFPDNPQAVASFLSGRRYRQMCKKGAGPDKEKALRGYEPYLTQSKNFPDRFFCRLTCRLLKKEVRAAEIYMGGKKFQHTKELYDKGEHELMSEPELESDEDGLCADASEQTRQTANAMSSSPCESMQDNGQEDHMRAVDGSGSLQPLHPDIDVAKGQQRVRPPRPKRRKHANAG